MAGGRAGQLRGPAGKAPVGSATSCSAPPKARRRTERRSYATDTCAYARGATEAASPGKHPTPGQGAAAARHRRDATMDDDFNSSMRECEDLIGRLAQFGTHSPLIESTNTFREKTATDINNKSAHQHVEPSRMNRFLQMRIDIFWAGKSRQMGHGHRRRTNYTDSQQQQTWE